MEKFAFFSFDPIVRVNAIIRTKETRIPAATAATDPNHDIAENILRIFIIFLHFLMRSRP